MWGRVELLVLPCGLVFSPVMQESVVCSLVLALVSSEPVSCFFSLDIKDLFDIVYQFRDIWNREICAYIRKMTRTQDRQNSSFKQLLHFLCNLISINGWCLRWAMKDTLCSKHNLISETVTQQYATRTPKQHSSGFKPTSQFVCSLSNICVWRSRWATKGICSKHNQFSKTTHFYIMQTLKIA